LRSGNCFEMEPSNKKELTPEQIAAAREAKKK
jgi:hypothetical protein